MKAVVNKNICIGCGLCTSVASSIFTMDSDGLAVSIIEDELPLDLEEAAKEAESSCPVEAIIVE